MYKRTVLAIVIMCATLFLVDWYFQKQHAQQLLNWHQQQSDKKEQQLSELKKQIPLHTAKAIELPLIDVLDVTTGQQHTTALLQGNVVVVIAWNATLPERIMFSAVPSTEGKDQEKMREATIAYDPGQVGKVALYRTENNALLDVPELSDFGSYDLQLFQPSPSSGDYGIVWAELRNGQLSIAAERVAQLEEELDLPNAKNLPHPARHNALVLLKSGAAWQPVAFYKAATGQVLRFNELSTLQPFVRTIKPQTQLTATAGKKGAEEFFVLETPYQQLVFSNWGGALVEINLPFGSKEDPKSVVKEISFDRDMVEEHPYNARFPAHPYHTAAEGNAPIFVDHAEGVLGGYYPLLRRDLIAKKKGQKKIVRIPPRFYALNIVSEYPEVAELVYAVKHFDNKSIVFEAEQPNRKITKSYSINDGTTDAAPYCVDLSIKIEGDSRGLWLTTGVPEVEWISGAAAPVLKYRMTRNKKSEVTAMDLPADAITISTIAPDWLCNSNGFFGMILDPLTDIDAGLRAQYVSGEIIPSRLTEIDEKYHRFEADKLPGYQMMLPLKNNSTTPMHFRIYAGPFATDTLKLVDARYSDPAIGYNPDYVACQSFHGWFTFISEPFANFLFILIRLFHAITHSWGFSIILLTVALRLMLYPLNAWSIKATARMQLIMPQVQAIQQKYKKDKVKAQQEVLNLYRENKVNPVSGCLPILIQLPFLIGMFDLLKSTFELRGASFIPGWIDNLAAPDMLFSWGIPLPLLGSEFHLLPILLGLVMFFQQRMMSNLPADPALWTEQQRQQRSMGTIMALIFTVMFYNVPSGLNIYWLSSMLLGILQQWWTTKRLKAAPAVTR